MKVSITKKFERHAALGEKGFYLIRSPNGAYLQVVSPGPKQANFGDEAVLAWTPFRKLAAEFHKGVPAGTVGPADFVKVNTVLADGSIQHANWAVSVDVAALFLARAQVGRLVFVHDKQTDTVAPPPPAADTTGQESALDSRPS